MEIHQSGWVDLVPEEKVGTYDRSRSARAHDGLLHRLDAAQFPGRVVNYADSRSHHGRRPWPLLSRKIFSSSPLPTQASSFSVIPSSQNLSIDLHTSFSLSLSLSLSHTHRHFPCFPWMAPTTKIGASPRLRLTRYYLQRTYVTFRTAYYCDYRRIMRRPSVLQFIIELL